MAESSDIYTQMELPHFLSVCPRTTWSILWILRLSGNMKHWNYPTTYSHSHRIHRLCPTLRTNIILRCNCHHKSTLSNPIYRHHPCRMNLRWLFCRQSNTNTILCLPLHSLLHSLFVFTSGQSGLELSHICLCQRC